MPETRLRRDRLVEPWASIATHIGALSGGYLVGAVSWRLIFAINVPFVAITLALITLAVPVPVRAPRSAAPGRVELRGVLLTFLGLAGPLALIDQRNRGASPARPFPGAR